MVYVMIARVPAEGVEAFRDYEETVLPLLGDHGGRLDRRLRSEDGTVEVHVAEFASEEGFEAYRSDPRRAAHARALEESGADIELLALRDAD